MNNRTRNDSQHNRISNALKKAGYHVGLGFPNDGERGCLRVIVKLQPVTITTTWERGEGLLVAATLIHTHSGTYHDGTPWTQVYRHEYSPRDLQTRFEQVGDTPTWYTPPGVHRAA